ncbi:MAG: hypothetical protein C5B51_08495 [Terriglobia bacterium]|nr:MAG: hypothetical protein C5B51_08495 [Terriglobia bacterium]
MGANSGREELEIFNFTATRHVQGVILPPEGARITVGKQPVGVRTIEQWIRKDLVNSQTSLMRELKSNGKSGGCRRLTEVQWHWEIGPQEYFQETAYYCASTSGLYRVQLTYWAENPHGQELQSIALRVASSLSTW